MSDGSDINNEDIHGYIATAKDQGSLNDLLMQARVMNETIELGLWQDYYQQKGTQLGGMIAQQGKQVAKQGEQLDQG